MSENQKTMTLITSIWGENKTFKLIPTSLDCPFVEAIYDTTVQALFVVGKDKKQQFNFLPKLDDDGQMILRKKTAKNENPYKQQRVLLETYYEYHLTEKSEIEAFLNRFADNASTYDFDRYLNPPVVAEEQAA